MDGYWILNAPGHRAHEYEQTVVAIAEHTLRAPDDEHVIIDAGEEWVCDGCNGTVAVFQPAGHGGPDPTLLPPAGCLNPVPVVAGRVLCSSCFVQEMGGDLSPAARWPGCGCPPCRHAAGERIEPAAAAR